MGEGRLRIKVWDVAVRLLHWLLAAAVLTAWWSSHEAQALHERAGYVALAAVLSRLLWSRLGSRPALGSFVRGPRATGAYARAAGRARAPLPEPQPLGGWMALALWAGVLATVATGWLFTTDAFWGEAWVENLPCAGLGRAAGRAGPCAGRGVHQLAAPREPGGGHAAWPQAPGRR
jgi:cytochrome b